MSLIEFFSPTASSDEGCQGAVTGIYSQAIGSGLRLQALDVA